MPSPFPQDPMKFIWDHQAQTAPDGKKYIRYAHNGEIAYLYRTGFVDTAKFTQEEWMASFNSSKHPDGSFWLNEEQWMSKRKYIYTGPIAPPFDPLTLTEGPWTAHDFENLLTSKILPAIDVDEKSLRSLLPTKGIQADKAGKIYIKAEFKNFLQTLITDRPSPAQARAFNLKEAQKKLNKTTASKNTPENSLKASTQTSFSIGPSNAQQTQNQFSQLLSKK